MTPQAVQAQSNVPAISIFNHLAPDISNKLVNKYGKQGLDYLMLLRSLGYEKPTFTKKYGHKEDDWLHQNFVNLNNVTAPGPGNNALITLDPTSLDGNNNFFPQVTDDVLFPNGVVGIIISINVSTPSAPVLTVRPKVATEDIGAISAGAELVINSNSQSEGAGPRKSILDNLFSYENELKIVQTVYDYTGSYMAQGGAYFNGDTNGQSYVADYLRGDFNSEYRHSLAMSGALLFDKIPTNTGLVDPASGLPYTGTEGLAPYIERVGNPYPYTAGTLSMADNDAISLLLDKENAGPYIMWLMGNQLLQETENYLVDYFGANFSEVAIAKQVASDVFGGNEALAMSVEFSQFKKSGRVNILKKMECLHHPKLYGAAGYKGPTLGFGISLDKQKATIDGVQTSAPSIGFRYKEHAGYSRMYEVIESNGAGNKGVKTSLVDKNVKKMQSEIGAHHSGGNKMILMKG